MRTIYGGKIFNMADEMEVESLKEEQIPVKKKQPDRGKNVPW